MNCVNCGADLTENEKFCPHCGTATGIQAQNFSDEKSNEFHPNPQDSYYQPDYNNQPAPSKSKIAAGILGIILGSLGIHKFYLGYTKSGVIMLLVTLLTFGFGGTVMSIIGLVEGIIYLTKSDDEFYQTYEANQKQWF